MSINTFVLVGTFLFLGFFPKWVEINHVILPQLHEQGVERIMTAFDMDFMENPHVQGGYRTLVSLLSDAGFRYGTYLWDPRYKGLDDYVWEHCFQRQLS